jgi:hypothetical protein
MGCGVESGKCTCGASPVPPANVPPYNAVGSAAVETPHVAPVYNWAREPGPAPPSDASASAGVESPLVMNSSAEWDDLFRQDAERRRAANTRGKRRGARR